MKDFEKIGEYEVVAKIGQGSFGIVYRGRDPYLKRDVAIKICSVADNELRERFYREAEIAGRLQHENIVTVFSFGVEGELPYLVQEFLAGEDLDRVIKRQTDIAPLQRLEWLRQIACGLVYAHEHGIIHRDIKPGNVRVLPGGQIKIMDFGIAKLANAETQLTQKGVTMGSAAYLPPEQIQAEELDQRADIFSFGVLAYELFSYQRPFRGNTLSAVVYQILYKVPPPLGALWPVCPEPFAELVARCMEKAPEKRYPSFRDLLPELDALRDAMSQTSFQATPLATARGIAGAPAGASPDATQPIAVAGARKPGRSTQPISEIDEAQPTVLIEDQRVHESRSLVDRAQEIARLVQRGELDEAMRELEDTYVQHQDAPAGTGSSSRSSSYRLSSRTLWRRRAGVAAVWLAGVRATAAAAGSRLYRRAAAGVEQARDRLAALDLGRLRPGGQGFGSRPVLFAAGGIIALLVVVLAGWRLSRKAPDAAPPPSLAETPAATVPSPALPTPSPSTQTTETGLVRVTAVPWGEVAEIVDAEGVLQPLTDAGVVPARFALPVGRYRIALRHPASDSSRNGSSGGTAECDVRITAGGVARCDAVLSEPDAIAYFKEMGWWR